MRKHSARKCSCYGGFDCEICNPKYYELQRQHGTPWTDPMNENKKNTTANEWADAIAHSLSKKTQTVPKGFYTQREIAKQLGKKATQTKTYIQDLLNDGKAEMMKFKIQTNTKPYPVPHYRLLK